ncbi:MAG: S41 family peptidase [Dehalococcoidia bacterium]|jgi:carboxyl-terminal processing protease|nr:S41 family peptidase [Dehalococcoidia bacterium]
MGSNTVRNVLLAVLLGLVAVLFVAVGFLGRIITEGDADVVAPPVAAVQTEVETTIDYQLIAEILAILNEDFVEQDRVDYEFLFEGAIQGVFDALGDPHSTYIDPNTWAISRGDFSGTFQGIGANVSQQGDFVVIVRALPNTPAERAGIQAGDQILEVDGESAEGWSLDKAVLRIRGQRGSSVELLVRHTDGTEERIVIVRDEIFVASVTVDPPGGVLRDAEGIDVTEFGYIAIRSFTQLTPQELQEALSDAVSRGVKGLILDVRSNSGGLLIETAQVADMFLDGGLILTQVNRAGREDTIEARPGTLTDLPLVIVQDEFSASGAELLAAALQENGRAKVVGTRSFGKGTVNHARELSNGGAVYVSIARWLTPARNQIEGLGVTPDVEIVITPEDIEERRDVALFRAIDLLRGEAS